MDDTSSRVLCKYCGGEFSFTKIFEDLDAWFDSFQDWFCEHSHNAEQNLRMVAGGDFSVIKN